MAVEAFTKFDFDQDDVSQLISINEFLIPCWSANLSDYLRRATLEESKEGVFIEMNNRGTVPYYHLHVVALVEVCNRPIARTRKVRKTP